MRGPRDESRHGAPIVPRAAGTEEGGGVTRVQDPGPPSGAGDVGGAV